MDSCLRWAIVTALLLVCGGSQAHDAARLGELRASARAAHQKRDHAQFLAFTRQTLEIDPRAPASIYNLACGLALTGQPDAALDTLERLVGMGLYFDFQRDEDLASLRPLERFAAVIRRADELKRPFGRARVAFKLAEQDLLTEGLAYDGATKDFFVSSVHRRKVVRIQQDGHARDFIAAGQDGLLGALALRVDERRKVLWVASAAVPEMQGYRPEDAGRAALLAFRLSDGRLERKLQPPGPPETRHNFNDLALDALGTLYLSDAVSGQIFRLGPAEAVLEVLVPAGEFRSPQGLVPSADGRGLFVADYGRGLFRVELKTRVVEPVASPPDLVLAGIDGLIADGERLLAIQNGIEPHRVVRLDLDPGGRRVLNHALLARALPEMNEPTLGVVVEQALYFVANSQWAAFAKGEPDAGQLGAPTVLALDLR